MTCLLQQWRTGDKHALDELMPLIYGELRSLAGRVMRGERPGHTLCATAVVHEAYVRLRDASAPVSDRSHFFALAAVVMRHILLDWAKASTRGKRGGGALHETLHDDSASISADPETILEIDRLLLRLAAFDPRKVKVVEMIFFAGMTYDEAGEALDVSPVTVHRELKMAKAWMRAELTPRATMKSA